MQNILKKIVISLLASATISTSVFATEISPWAIAEYNNANSIGIISESIATQNLTENITKQEICNLIVNTYKKITGDDLVSIFTSPFPDTADENIVLSYCLGILPATNEEPVNPDSEITREEFSKIIVNFLIATEKNIDIHIKTNEILDFNSVSPDAKFSVATAIENDLINGRDYNFDPKCYTTREEAISVFNRIFQRYNENPFIQYYNVPEIKTEETDTSITCYWDILDTAQKYTLHLKDENGNIIYSKDTINNFINIEKNELPYSENFTITVSAFINEDTSINSLPNKIKVMNKRDKLIKTCEKYLGVPYVWGGTTPSGFDCSGLVQYVYNENGYSLTRTTYTQWANDGTYVSFDELLPGDLVYFGASNSPSHVGMYAGNGMMIHSPQTGDVVKYQTIETGRYRERFIGGKRIF